MEPVGEEALIFYPIRMDIRTKLVFVLVAVALGSMFALGFVMSATAGRALREARLEQLDGLAEAKKEGLEQIFQGWIDRVNLVASRTQLRLNLQDHNETGDPEAAARIGRILSDAVGVVPVIEALAVYDVNRQLVATAGIHSEPATEVDAAFSRPVADGLFYQGVTGSRSEGLRVGFMATLVVEGVFLGDLHVTLSGKALMDLTELSLGLGNTGETLVVSMDGQGTPRVLHRSRMGGGEIWDGSSREGGIDPVRLALEGREGVHWQDVQDDRGEPVWVAIRNLPEAGWGLMVKVDAREGQASIEAFRSQALRMTLSLGAFAILIGAILGFSFARPIHDLALATNRVREGESGVRVPVVGEDEVSVLARNFNQMADELEDRVALLNEFQRYFDLSRDMLCIAGTDGYFKRVNPAFRRTLGWNTRQLLSAPFLDFVHPDDLNRTRNEINRLTQGLPTISFENRYRIPQGGYRTLMWTAHPDEGTGLIYAIARDVTDQKRAWEEAEEEMVLLRQRLKEAEEKLKGTPWSS